ncbi:MAG TPA: TIGR04086 family membrane protein [Symbiobacteriaceae bacterium]|nr:TIGR04086 family membrane protein [Symbiobacteriaceae bacterium]
MHGESNATRGVNLRAVGVGMIWGLGMMVLSLLMQSVVSALSPMSEATVGILALAYKGLGALFGGYIAAKRAAGAGWLHGAIAGTALMLSLLAVMGVAGPLPLLADFLKVVGVGSLLGTLGGVVGVNAGNR